MGGKDINLLTKVKSRYILNIIFSPISQAKKLRIAIDNKYLQERLKIDSDDYKNASGKYKESLPNGLVQIFKLDTKKLIYEGEYSNRKKNGKGKIYWNDRLEYEGEFVNGKKSGKGKEYDIFKNKLLYEGDFFNDKRHGKGKKKAEKGKNMMIRKI